MTSLTTPAATIENARRHQAELIYLAAACLGLVFPGALLGALLFSAVWAQLRDSLARRLCWAVVAAWLAIATQALEPGWIFDLVVNAFSRTSPPLPSVSGVLSEALFGPALLLTLQGGAAVRRQTVFGQLAKEHDVSSKQARAMRVGYQPRKWSSLSQLKQSGDDILLGVDTYNQPFTLSREETTRHTSVTGATGEGKTTTLMRLTEGHLRQGCSIIVIDCKGIGLGEPLRKLAQTHDVGMVVVDPDSPDTIGYDPCTGSRAHVANKVVGAFSYSKQADIYKNVALEFIPPVVTALPLAGLPVDLVQIYKALGKGGLARLARSISDRTVADRLLELEQEAGGIGKAGYAGLQRRLGALIEGHFGSLFSLRPALDLDAVTTDQTITYLPLSTTAHSEDVALCARVYIQDLKQLCHRRLRQIELGQDVRPTLIIIDEFAVVDDAEQIQALLLQARGAHVSMILATQFLPTEPRIRTPFLQSALMICHRVAAEDAESFAAEFGTHDAPELTQQIDYETGYSQKGSKRTVKVYNVHPDRLKELPTGVAAVISRATNRRAILRILPP